MENKICDRHKIKIVLQGREQPFESYEVAVQKLITEIEDTELAYNIIVMPSASQDGRLCSIINYKIDIKNV